MKKSKHTELQIISILKEQKSLRKVADICLQQDISQTTFFKWKSKLGCIEVNQLHLVGIFI